MDPVHGKDRVSSASSSPPLAAASSPSSVGYLANAMGQKVGLLAGNWVPQCLLERESPDDYDDQNDDDWPMSVMLITVMALIMIAMTIMMISTSVS